MILLDTCALIWLATNAPQLSSPARDAMEKAGGVVYVSPITIFEIGQKQASGKLTLPMPIHLWFEAIFKQYGLAEAPFSSATAARATQLPPLHKDPFDRLIIATAMEQDYVLLTPDEHIRQYPGVATMW